MKPYKTRHEHEHKSLYKTTQNRRTPCRANKSRTKKDRTRPYKTIQDHTRVYQYYIYNNNNNNNNDNNNIDSIPGKYKQSCKSVENCCSVASQGTVTRKKSPAAQHNTAEG